MLNSRCLGARVRDNRMKSRSEDDPYPRCKPHRFIRTAHKTSIYIYTHIYIYIYMSTWYIYIQICNTCVDIYVYVYIGLKQLSLSS